MSTHSDVVTVFSTGSVALFAYAKSLLDAAGISYIPKGEYIHNAFGPSLWGGSQAFILGPMELQVLQEDESKAKELLAEVKESSGDASDE